MRNNIPFAWDVTVLQNEDGTRAFLSYDDYLCAIVYCTTNELWYGAFPDLGGGDGGELIKARTLPQLASIFKAAILSWHQKHFGRKGE